MIMEQDPREIALLKSRLKTLAQRGCGNCYAQDCDWPSCVREAKEVKEQLDAAEAKPKVTVLPYMGKPEDPKRKDFVPLTVHTDGVIRKRARIIESEE